MTISIDCSVILGTVNRPEMLKECIQSVRESLTGSGCTYEIVIAYGSEDDTSMEWLRRQPDIRPVLGGTGGAIPAFNKAYEASKGRLICQINDDVLVEGASIANAIRHLDDDPTLGAVVFHMSRDRGASYMKMDFQQVRGLPHPNQVVARREMCEDIIAEGFGAFWGDENSRTHHTYGGDSAWGLWAHRLGWGLERKPDVKLLDLMNETSDDPHREFNMMGIREHQAEWSKMYGGAFFKPITRDPMGWPNVYNPKRGMPQRRSPIEAGPQERVLHISLEIGQNQPGLGLEMSKMGPYQMIRWNERRQEIGFDRMYEEVYELIRTHQPTLIWMQVQGAVAFTSDIISQMRKLAPPNCLIVSWTGDARTDVDEPVEPWMVGQCKELDLFLSSECTYAEKLREMGVKAKTGHMICGTDIIVNQPRQGNPADWQAAGKACFTGSTHTGFHKGNGCLPRVQMALDIEAALPGQYVCYGHQWDKLNLDIQSHPFIARSARAELHSVARVVVVQSLFQKLRRYSSDRLGDSLYTKGFCAIQHFDDMEGYGFRDGVNCVTWKDNEELVELLRDWLRPERDADRAVIQEAGYELARKNWTWDVAVEQLLAIVREERRLRDMPLLVAPTPETPVEPGVKLHVACGPKHIEGYVNTDLRPGPAVDQVLDAREKLPANTYSEIYASHVLEHFYPDETLDILKNWHQALQDGGILRLSVPDLRLIVANCVESHKFGKDPNAPLFGDFRKAAEEPDRHKQTFIKESLAQYLTKAGFKDLRFWKSADIPEIHAVKDWSSYDTISLNIFGRKQVNMDTHDSVFGPRLVGAPYRTDRFGPLMEQFTLDQVREGVDEEELAHWMADFGVGYENWKKAWQANQSNFLDVHAWGHDHDFGGGHVIKGTMDDRHITNLERVVQPGGLDPDVHVNGKKCLVVGAYCGGEVLMLHALGATHVDALEEVPEYAAATARLADGFGIRQATFAASLFELPDAWTSGQVTKTWDGPVGLVKNLPERQRYDLVYCPGVIYHCTDQVATLRILRDLLVPGGSLFYETGVAGNGDAVTYLGPSVPGWNWWVCGSKVYQQMMTDVGMENCRHVETTGGRAWFGGVRGDADPLTENACAGFAIPSLLGR